MGVREGVLKSGPSVFRPAWWLRNPHAQTIWGRVVRRPPRVETTVEVVETGDADSLELHHLAASSESAPRVLLLHGLEGSRNSHYVGGLLHQASTRGWGATLLVFRGCGDTPNTARRFYHSGETSDLDFVFRALRTRWPQGRWLLAGVSLGGNVMLKWLGEQAAGATALVAAAAAVSVPYDLEAGARRIAEGPFRIYDRSFLRSLRRKALTKAARIPGLLDAAAAVRARTLFEFDDCVTAPVHGFANAHDYYRRSSSIGFLPDVRVPTLLLSAADDPFLPATVLQDVEEIAIRNAALSPEFHSHGGHVGFVQGPWPWKADYYAERRVFAFFDQALARR